MTSTLEQDVLAPLRRIDDARAADLVSAQALVELKEAIFEVTPVPAPGLRSPRLTGRSPLVRGTAVLAGAAALAGIALGVEAVTNDGPAAPSVADATVLRGALSALARPGMILIESYTGIGKTNPKYGQYAPGTRPTHVQTYRFSAHEITETPKGRGAQNLLNLGGPGVTAGREIGEVDGTDELYVPARNTVYLTSQYGHSITKGPRPGTDVYTPPRIAPAPAGSAAAETNAHMPPPLTITATQARALRDGTAMVQTDPDSRARTTFHLKVVPAFREAVQDSDPTAAIRTQLAAGKLHVAGRTTIAGRAAIRLVGQHGRIEDDVAPGAYNPIRTITTNRAGTSTITYRQYRTLPITPANHRLLLLTHRHPGAKVIHNDRAYLADQG
jgi:hypothetical protein